MIVFTRTLGSSSAMGSGQAPPNGVIPAKAGIHPFAREAIEGWVPAFAGTTASFE
jgi:hypothetical protein